MNNATRESFSHSASPFPDNDRQDSCPSASDPFFGSGEDPADAGSPDIADALQQLKEIRLSPRASTIRAIMKYAREKNEAIH